MVAYAPSASNGQLQSIDNFEMTACCVTFVFSDCAAVTAPEDKEVWLSTARRRVALIVAVLFIPSIAPALADEDALFKVESLKQASIDQYRWNKRPILVFASSGQDEGYTKQLDVLRSDRRGLAERDIVVLSDLDSRATGDLREALRIEGFEVVLIGKDGGVKLRSKTPVSLDRLFARIDSMPMRQREMRSRPRTE